MPFTKDTLDFLVENRFRNDRPWYNAHKDRFAEVVLQPFQELVVALTPTMRALDPLLDLTPKVDKTISRVYRDTRFTHDKSLFRDVMWIAFRRPRQAGPWESPVYWFELSPKGMAWGCGTYKAPTDFLSVMRARILADDPLFLRARRMVEQQDAFSLDGERYKRSKHPDQPESMKYWLDRKSVGLSTTSQDFGLAFSDKLSERLAADFRMLHPMYQFWCSVEEERLATAIHK